MSNLQQTRLSRTRGTLRPATSSVPQSHSPALATFQHTARYNDIPAKADGLSTDQELWWNETSPHLRGLLKYSGTYTPAEQEDHLRFFRNFLVAQLGHAPSPTHRCSAFLTIDGVPLRPSWNFSEKGPTTVRVSFQPIGPEDGTAADPFGQNYLRRSVTPFSQAANPPADMTWYKELMAAMYMTPEQEACLYAKTPQGAPLPPYHFISYGFTGAKRKIQAYFHPFGLAQAVGKPSPDLIYAGVRAVTTLGDGLAPAIDVVEQYTSTHPQLVSPACIGVDCVEPAKARLKVYGMSSLFSFNAMKHIMTLGGKMTDPETMRGVEMLQDIYPLLMNEKGPMDPEFSKEVRLKSSTHNKVIVSFEMRPGHVMPEVKLYIPVWQFAESEGRIIENVTEIFRRLGWTDNAAMYGPALQEAL